MLLEMRASVPPYGVVKSSLPKQSENSSTAASSTPLISSAKELTTNTDPADNQKSRLDVEQQESASSTLSTLGRESTSFKSSRRSAEINPALRNQMSTSRAMTVELGTLRDMMPKLKREVHIYSINECQLVKELEKKLPSCNEHKDVRLNLILEEIQRIRLNRRRALEKLKESQVKIAELEFRMELSSYQAGEIFWDGKISKLSDEKYNNLESFTQKIEEKQSQENFAPTPIIDNITRKGMLNERDENLKTLELESRADIENRRRFKLPTEGTFTQDGLEAKTSLGEGGRTQNMLVHATSPSVLETPNPSVYVTSIGSMPSTNANAVLDAENKTFATGNSPLLTGEDDLHSRILAQKLANKGLAEQGGKGEFGESLKEIDDIVAEAHQQKSLLGKIKRKGFILYAIPASAAVGMLLVEWQTKAISTYLGPLLGR